MCSVLIHCDIFDSFLKLRATAKNVTITKELLTQLNILLIVE